jgi:hypothetical protein
MSDNELVIAFKVDKENGLIALKDMKGNIIDIGKAIKEAQEAVKKNTEKMTKSFNLTTIAINSFGQIARQLTSFISDSFKKAGHFEGLQMSMETLLGSAEEAKTRFKELADFTKGTSFEVGQVVQASNELQSLGKYSQETLAMLSNLAMGSGKSLEQVTNAYSAMVKGRKNMAVELFRDIGITTEDFARATKKGLDEATGMIKASSQEMVDSLGKIIQDKNFEDLIEKQNNTLEGQLGNMRDAIDQFMADVGMKLLPIVTSIMPYVLGALDLLKNNVDWLAKAIIGLTITVGVWKILNSSIATSIVSTLIPSIKAQVAASNTTLLPAIGKLIKASIARILGLEAEQAATMSLTFAVTGLGTAIKMALGPIGLAIAAGTTLIACWGVVRSIFFESAEAKLEDKNAELELIEASKESIETKKAEQKEIRNLCDEYVQLAEQSDEAGNNEKRLTEITKKLNAEYPGLIKEGKDFKDSIEAVGEKALEARNNLGEFNAQLRDIELQTIETKKAISELTVQATEEELFETFADETQNVVSRFYDSIENFLFGTSQGLKKGKEFFEEFTESSKNAINEK